MCSCPKIDRLPYRLPELLAADPGATVYVGEGEKDTNRLWDEGLVATCNSGGAKKWEAYLSDYLVGRDVVIPPDNDNDGEAHGQLVARLLQGKARSVKVLDLPGLGAKGDVSDWLDQGGTIDKLVRLAGDCENGSQKTLILCTGGRILNPLNRLRFRHSPLMRYRLMWRSTYGKKQKLNKCL